ncbi:MAG: hypothetical protein Q7K71_04890, partial [Candidatus Omnitrophota bacterium]|nr:hypothetical protein [Candidatus Omnitrophota bacterium]
SAGTGAEKMRITATGNVGIATFAPNAFLDISSTTNQDLFRVNDNGTGDTSPFIIKAGGNVGIGTTVPTSSVGAMRVLDISGTSDVSLSLRKTDAAAQDYEFFIGSDESLQFRDGIAGATRMYIIPTTGNVGIGTAAPPQLLYVAGTAEAQGFKLNQNAVAGYVLTSSSVGVGTWMAVSTLGGGSGTVNSGTINQVAKYAATGTTVSGSSILFDDATNVGIGTALSDAKLEVMTSAASATANALQLTNEGLTANRGFGTGIVFRSATTAADGDLPTGRIYSAFDGSNYPTARLTLQSITGGGGYFDTLSVKDNNVGIATFAPNAFLDISSTTDQDLFRVNDNGTGDASPFIIKADGNVGIGTSAPNALFGGAKLSISGTTAGSTPSLVTTSDIVLGADASLFFDSIYAYEGSGNHIRPIAGGQTFVTAGKERMRINSSGNVGIGSLSPASAPTAGLHVVQAAAADAFLVDDQDATDSSPFVIKSDGNVGIGTTTPQAQFVVSTGNVGIGTWVANNRFQVVVDDSQTTLGSVVAMAGFKNTNTTNNTASVFSFQSTDSGGTNFGGARIGAVFTDHTSGSTNAAFVVDTVNDSSLTEKFRITDAGNVGIGTTVPAGIFHVKSSVDAGVLVLGDDTGLTTDVQRGLTVLTHSGGNVFIDAKTFSGGAINFRTGEGTETGSARTWMTVDPTAGNVGIGTTLPRATLEVANYVGLQKEFDIGSQGGAFTITSTNGNKQKVTLTGTTAHTVTWTAPSSGLTANFVIKVVQGSGTDTLTWPATVKWAGGTAPTLTTTNGATDILGFYFDGTNFWGAPVVLNGS